MKMILPVMTFTGKMSNPKEAKVNFEAKLFECKDEEMGIDNSAIEVRAYGNLMLLLNPSFFKNSSYEHIAEVLQRLLNQAEVAMIEHYRDRPIC